MKKIAAIIRPERVGPVRKALEEVNCPGLTIIQVDGHGNQRGTIQKINGEEYKVGILPKTKIELVVKDGDVLKVVAAIRDAARTGRIGDGKIFVSPIDEVIRVRTGEIGGNAL
ncbi:MAG: P-II family nitrogen regulator [Candidatus Omnitrophota bacterium]